MEREMNSVKLVPSWYVVYTSPRSEKRVNQILNDLGFETYCPTRKVLRQWSDRKRMVDIVLFTSYVFVKVNAIDFPLIYGVRGFVRFVSYLGKPAIVRDSEIEDIKLFLEGNVNCDVKFEVDKKVKITMGPLKGQSGNIERIGKNTVKIRIESLGMSLVAHVSKNKVESIS